MFKIYSNFIPTEDFEKIIKSSPELKSKPITVFNDYPNIPLDQLQENPYNILMVMEPNQLFGIHNWAIENSHLFSCILTWGQEILDNCPNSPGHHL
jgi:hypothetical protein